MFKFGLGQDIGIDLGTATVIAYVKGKGVLIFLYTTYFGRASLVD